jgi:DNA polymerase-3 subunit delta'
VGPYAVIRELAGRDKLSHAWLILGGEAAERRALADYAARALLCSGGEKPCGVCPHCRKMLKGIHPDLSVLEREPDKREISVAQIRALRQEAWVLPNEGRRRVFLLPEADCLNLSAQNALLKVLEEPPAYAAFLLLGEGPGSFLPTVRSRCLTLWAAPAPDAVAGNEAAGKLAEAWIRGDRLAFAAAAFPCEKLEREKFDALVEELSLAAALRARAGEGAVRRGALLLFRQVEELREMRRVNVSAGHCLGWLGAVMPSE